MRRLFEKATGMGKLLLVGILVFMFSFLAGSNGSTVIGQVQALDLEKTLQEHQVDPSEQTQAITTETPKPATQAGIDGTVDCGATLRVRAWPWGQIIGGFRNGDKVTVLGTSGDFYRIEFRGKTAYVHRNYVSLPGKPAGKYGVTYPAGCAEGGNGYLPRPGTSAGAAPAPKPTTKPTPKPDEGNKPPADKPSNNSGSKPSSIDLNDAKTVGKRMGDGTRIGAVAWGMDQMKGGTQHGVNSNNGKRSSDSKAWNGYCLAFVGTCWGRKVPDLRASSAYNAYKQCKAAGRTFHKRGVPTPGAAMFFGPTAHNPYGHAIIATGEVDRNGDPIILSTTGHGGLYGIQKMPLHRMIGMMGSAPFYGWTSMP